jgi:hypothetical protein
MKRRRDNFASRRAPLSGTMLVRVSECVPTMPAMEAVPAPVHVLAVDDDPSVRQMIADYLGDNDIKVTRREAEGNRRSWRAIRSISSFSI